MKKYLLIAVLLLIPTQVKAEICFADADGVRHHSPGSYPSYTRRMEGHKNEKCWFPSTKSDKRWHASGNKRDGEKPLKQNANPVLTTSPTPMSGVPNATQSDSDVVPQKSYTHGIKTDNVTLQIGSVPVPREMPNVIKIKHVSDGIKNYIGFFEELNQIDRFDKWARGLF